MREKKQKRCLKSTDNKPTEIDREQKLKQANMPPKGSIFQGHVCGLCCDKQQKNILITDCYRNVLYFIKHQQTVVPALPPQELQPPCRGSDDGLPAGLAFNELDGSFNLGQHGAGCEMPSAI